VAGPSGPATRGNCSVIKQCFFRSKVLMPEKKRIT
jgi:hypothetical protein